MSETPNNDISSGEEEKLDNSRKIVTNIFRKIHDNQTIPETVKPIIDKLQPSVMNIALATPNLFAFESHYARVFIENVHRISVDWVGLEDSNNSYLKKLETVVNSICEKDKYINKDFIKYQNELEKSLVKLRKRAAIKQKREEEKLLGQKKINEAKDETATIIAQKINDLTITSDYINHILYDEWTSVLVLLHIRNGQNSEFYQSNVEFVDLLIDLSSRPVSLSEAKEKYKSLFKKYQNGLSLVAFNKQEIKERKQKLLEFFNDVNKPIKIEITPEPQNSETLIDPQEILNQSQHHNEIKEIINQGNEVIEVDHALLNEKEVDNLQKEVGTENENPNSLDDEQTVNSKPNKTPIDDDKLDYNTIVSSLKIGTWFEIKTNNSKSIKAKLSWVSPITEKHLFVDSQGLKISDKTKTQLIDGLKNNTIRIIHGFE